VTARDVIEMDSRLSGDLSLNTRIGDGDRSTEWEATLVDDAPGAKEIVAEHGDDTGGQGGQRRNGCVRCTGIEPVLWFAQVRLEVNRKPRPITAARSLTKR
jgi:hypothetical protein